MANQSCKWQQFLDKALCSPEPIVGNAAMPTRVIEVGHHRMPVSINRQNSTQTSWVASLANSYGPYARAEMALVKMPRYQRPFYGLASLCAEYLLRMGGLTGGAFLNNWYLATNLHPSGLGIEAVMQAVEQLVKEHVDLPVVLRSLTPPLHRQLLTDLVQAGFLLIPTRQVWIAQELLCDSWMKHSDVRRDLSLAKRKASQFSWAPGTSFTASDFAQGVELYDALYRGKYPLYNPSYTEKFFREGVATGFLNLQGLRRNETGDLCGLVGVIGLDGVYATPVLGYELSSPQDEGLYRQLMLQAFLTARANKGILHCSGGAGSFKKQRGAQHHVEFAAVWANHLPKYRQASLSALHKIVKAVAVPYLESRAL